jgi:hypothetical protein
LATLFEDLLAKQPRMLEAMNAGGGTALSVRYQCGLDATVLVSKNSGRLRVQSSSFEGLWLFADELVRRLTTFHLQRGQQGSEEEPYAVLYAEPLPLQEYFELIDEHLGCRIALAALYDELTMRAQQFRVVEKRLSVRDTEKLVAQTAADSVGTPSGGRPRRTVDADLARLQERLADHLNAPVELHTNARGKGRLVIHFDSVEQFEGLRAALGLDTDTLDE